MQHEENLPLPQSAPVLEPWFKAYKETNITFPMAPAATDSLIGAAVFSSLASRDVSPIELFYSQLNKSQLEEVGDATTKIHAAHHIPVVVKGHEKQLTPTQLVALQEQTKAMIERGGFGSSKKYKIDPKLGVGVVSEGIFRQGWAYIKERIFKTILDYMDQIPGLDIDPPRKGLITRKGQAFSLSLDNAKRLENFFTNPEFAPYVEALTQMYLAAESVMQDPEVKSLGLSQRQSYNLGKGGKEEFRVTEPVQSLISLIDQAVTQRFQEIGKDTPIPKQAKDVFVDVITRRKDQPKS